MKPAKQKSESRLISNLCVASIVILILAAVVFDLIVFAEVILKFVAALILPCIAFVIFFVAMIASCMFIFGIYLLEEYGFWPLTLSIQFFDEIMGDITFTTSQLESFRAFRIVLIVLCVAVFVMAIVGKSLAKNDKKNENYMAYHSSNGKCNASMVFAILGILISVAAIAITSAL